MSRRSILICLFLGAVLFGGQAAQAQNERLFGAIGAGSSFSSSTLVELDPATGSVINTVGDAGYLINGLAWDAEAGVMYATTSANDSTAPNRLATINLETAAVTIISASDVATDLGDNAVPLLAIDSGGNLFGWLEASSDDLLLWNKADGTAAIVGDAGLSTATHSLSFNAADELLLINFDGNVYEIDTSTGGSTSVGSISGIAHHGNFRPSNDLFYGIDDSYGNNPRNIVVLDMSTLNVVDTLPTADDLHVIEFVTQGERVGVPLASPAVLALLAVLLLLFGGFAVRRLS